MRPPLSNSSLLCCAFGKRSIWRFQKSWATVKCELIKNGLTALRQRSHTKIHSSLVYWPISLYTHVKNNLTRVFFKMNLSLGFHFRSGCVCMLALSTPLGYQCKPHEPWRLRLHHPHSPPYKHTQMRTRLPHCCHLHKSSVSVCGVCVCVCVYVCPRL